MCALCRVVTRCFILPFALSVLLLVRAFFFLSLSSNWYTDLNESIYHHFNYSVCLQILVVAIYYNNAKSIAKSILGVVRYVFMQMVKSWKCYRKIKFSFNLIDIETHMHTHREREREGEHTSWNIAHINFIVIYDMHCWRFCQCYSPYSILIQFYFCWLYKQSANCTLEISNVKWNSVMELFDLIWFFLSFALRCDVIWCIDCVLLKGIFDIIPLFMIMMLNMVNYNTCNVCVAKHLNAWITWIARTGHTHIHYSLPIAHRSELMH